MTKPRVVLQRRDYVIEFALWVALVVVGYAVIRPSAWWSQLLILMVAGVVSMTAIFVVCGRRGP